MSTIDSANLPQEFPDIVGARPTKSTGGELQIVHSGLRSFAGTDMAAFDHGGAITGIVIAAKEMVGPACRHRTSDRAMVNSSQSVSERPVRGSTRLDSVFFNLPSLVRRGP